MTAITLAVAANVLRLIVDNQQRIVARVTTGDTRIRPGKPLYGVLLRALAEMSAPGRYSRPYHRGMHWLSIWWDKEVVDGYKGPLLLSFVAFVITFTAVRFITRMIRAGKGPFHDISGGGGVHLHHSTPGLLVLMFGSFMGIGAPPLSWWTYLAGALIGLGAALVLDEFAMLFRLQDVYWSQEGQLSVNMVTLAAALLGLAAAGVSPLNIKDLPPEVAAFRTALLVWLVIHFGFVAVTALKGKYPTALIGLFVGPVAWIAAVRLARPTSPWARHRYSPEKVVRARERANRFDARWGRVRNRWDDSVGGTPTLSAATAPVTGATAPAAGPVAPAARTSAPATVPGRSAGVGDAAPSGPRHAAE
jgi:hypothetical protein